MQLKGIIFDYGGVLCLHPPDSAVDELAALCGAGRDEFLHAYWSLRVPYDRGDLDAIAYWRGIGQRLGRSYSIAQIDSFRRRDIGFWVHLDVRMMSWARQVRACGLRTAVLSNLPRDLGEHLRNGMRLTAEFDHHSFSYELRVAKPEAAIYRHAVEGLGIAPGEALFLDDRAENVAGARAAGLHALQFVSPEVLKDQLADLSRGTGDLVPVRTPPVILE